MLEDFFFFIALHFARYFDDDVKVPDVYLAQEKTAADDRRIHITEALTEAGAGEALTDLLLDVHTLLEGSSRRVVTMRHVRYLQAVQSELLHTLDHPPADMGIDDVLRQLLYRVNYNSIAVVAYHADYYRSMLMVPLRVLKKLSGCLMPSRK